MSDFTQALIISGGIFAVMMASQFGRRGYSRHKVLLPLISVAAFGYSYLDDAPFGGNAGWLYLAGIAIGGGFAVLATLTTRVTRESDGKVYTTTGVGFVLTWLVAMALRIGFVWSLSNIAGFRLQVGIFMMDHHLVPATIAPFFVLMALATVVGRVIAVQVRVRRIATPDVTVTELVTA
ncbi:Protein of unknown function [Nakamurella panacisegetis]|uniref:DUF1453 domain-containing protein n=1 Tax=Nakamurella panacisegetis TaxID=1090615 RepID=A0A1H0LUT8_9ACTN|nr:hypothetical protein [Nakamurella panacisegetis]SDO72019.1 Protein of unknown function [Nakamurella panacisegetis]